MQSAAENTASGTCRASVRRSDVGADGKDGESVLARCRIRAPVAKARGATSTCVLDIVNGTYSTGTVS